MFIFNFCRHKECTMKFGKIEPQRPKNPAIASESNCDIRLVIVIRHLRAGAATEGVQEEVLRQARVHRPAPDPALADEEDQQPEAEAAHLAHHGQPARGGK